MASIMVLMLGALLLVHCSIAAPVASSASSEESEETGRVLRRLSQHINVITSAVDESVFLEKMVFNQGKEVLKKVLDDPKVQENKDEATNVNLNELHKYVEKLEKPSSSRPPLIEFIQFETIVNKYKEEVNVIGTSLKSNGLEDFEKSVFEHFEKFLENFNSICENYFANLNEKDKRMEKPVIEWFEKFKAENDIEMKLKQFNEFLVDFIVDVSEEDD